MNIKSKIVKGILGLEMIASLGACKTVMMNGYSVTCSPFENYPSEHQCLKSRLKVQKVLHQVVSHHSPSARKIMGEVVAVENVKDIMKDVNDRRKLKC